MRDSLGITENQLVIGNISRFAEQKNHLFLIDIFEKVREKLIINRKRAAKNAARADYFLSGKLFCGYCGEPMSGLSGTARNGDKHYYYRCNGVQKKSGCHKHNENKYALEDEICRAARALFDKMSVEETAQAIHEMYIAALVRDYDADTLETQLAECKKQAENIVNAIAQTGGNQMLFDKINELEERKNQLESSIRVNKAMENNIPSIEQIKVLIDDIRATDINTTEGKKVIAEIMISKVFVYDDKLTIIFKDKDGKSVDVPLTAVSDTETNAPETDCILSASGSQSRHIQTILGCVCVTVARLRNW